jgi:hypothetical protein
MSAFAIAVAFVVAAALIGGGVALLIQGQTDPRASASVGDCKTTGAGRFARTHCTGSWIAGGSLLQGGHVIVGTIEGVDRRDVGKTIEVTLRGDTAYARRITLPLLLIGLGLVPAVAGVARALAIMGARR